MTMYYLPKRQETRAWELKSLKYFYFTLINFNYIDLNIQIADKLTIKIDKKKN